MPKLLLVDGDAARARVLAAYLISGGYNVRIATSVERALSVAGVHLFDAIAIDLSTPHLDGIDAFIRLRQTGDVSIILLAGNPLSLKRLVQLDQMPDGCIAAPFKPRELESRINELIRKKMSTGNVYEARKVKFLFVDACKRQVFWKGRSLGLTVLEQSLFVLLLQAGEEITKKEALAKTLRGKSNLPVAVHLENLQSKLVVTEGALEVLDQQGGFRLRIRPPKSR
jgi:DNA-binding response OmpR family regulator